jgi:hypothetical protein
MEVLVRKIIPDIEVARPNAPSNPDGGGGPSGSADVLRGDTWASVNPGQTVRGVRFASDNKTISVLGARIGGFVGAVVPNFPRTVFVSPSSRAGGLVLITLWDDSYGCADAVVVDRAGAVKARGIVPKRWRVWREWVSWSPNEHYALLAAAGEVTMGDMVLVDVRTGKSLELHFRDLTGNRPGSDELVQEFEFENVEWIGPNRFRVRLDVHCNPYNGGACTDGRWEIVLRSYTATVELPSQRISYVPAANATPATPPKVTVRVYNVDDRAVVSVNGVDLQTVPFKGTSLFDVSNLLRSGSNTIRLRLLNDWQDYSYGFEVRRDAQTIFREECGQADVKGCFGSDTRAPKGVVYDKSVSVYVP